MAASIFLAPLVPAVASRIAESWSRIVLICSTSSRTRFGLGFFGVRGAVLGSAPALIILRTALETRPDVTGYLPANFLASFHAWHLSAGWANNVSARICFSLVGTGSLAFSPRGES